MCLCFGAFAEKIPESLRREFALKMHKGFCLQSIGQSTSAFHTFNEGYQEALKAGFSAKKLHAIGNLLTWYRKYGHYLGLFKTVGKETITDGYRGPHSRSSPKPFASKFDQLREEREIAEISRDMMFGVGEVIGGLLGVAFIPDLSLKCAAGGLAIEGSCRIWTGFNRLKTKNNIIAQETKLRIKEIELAASDDQDEW